MGHQRAAEALAQALVSAGADVAIADTLDYGRTAFRRVYRDLYLRVAERSIVVERVLHAHRPAPRC
jgi:hypothetical protein